MNKEQVFAELKNKWNLFDMTKEESEKAYYEITGLKNYEDVNVKYYLLDYVLTSIYRDGDATEDVLNDVEKEIIDKKLLEN